MLDNPTSLISSRPQAWNEIVGQKTVLTLLRQILANQRFMTKGFIFEGPYAVGKTSTAYLFSQALMCLGEGPLPCGECPSCKTELRNQSHPAFREVDAATYSGVAAMRELMERVEEPPTLALAKRRVVIIDEAHRLSPEAFDVFLKPLESSDMGVVFIFVTSEGSKIPLTIQSRCAHLRFGNVPTNDLTGMLMKRAEELKISYTLEGLRTVARHANGRPRDAIKNLGLVAAIGKVTPESTEAVLNYDAETVATTIVAALLKNDKATAVEAADLLSQQIGMPKLIEVLFAFLSRDILTRGEFAPGFAGPAAMNSFFLKWSGPNSLSYDIVPNFIYELSEMRKDIYQTPLGEVCSDAPAIAGDRDDDARRAEPPKAYMTLEEMQQRLQEG